MSTQIIFEFFKACGFWCHCKQRRWWQCCLLVRSWLGSCSSRFGRGWLRFGWCQEVHSCEFICLCNFSSTIIRLCLDLIVVALHIAVAGSLGFYDWAILEKLSIFNLRYNNLHKSIWKSSISPILVFQWFLVASLFPCISLHILPLACSLDQCA